jgi:hypothetical protein
LFREIECAMPECLRNIASDGQVLEQPFCLFQIDRVEAFGEPAIDRSKEIASPR